MADPFNASQSYNAVPNPVNPAVAQSPSSRTLNPVGDEYATEFSLTATETDLLKRDIAYAIFDAVPAKYKIFRLLFDKPVEYVGNDVFTYMEKTFGRTALKATAITASGATMDISVTAGTEANVTENKIIVFPDNSKAQVYTVTSGHVFCKQLNGKANLPAVAVNDYFSIQGSVIADGQNFLSHYDRMAKVERYNYVQLMERDKRWTRMEMTKFANLGVTNYFDLDKQEQMQLLLQDMFCSFWNGDRGEVEVQIPGAATYYYAKTMGGIYPLMVAAGCANSSGVTAATLKEVFEALAFQTDYKGDGGVRFIFAQSALLYELSKAWKEIGVRYTPNDKIADLNLNEYRIGEMRFVPVATELFKEISMFPATWKSRIFVLDLDTISPVCVTGYQPIETGQTLPKGQGGSINDYTEWWIQGMLSLKFNNPLSSFYIDTTGIV
jgi:hypothetical protein